MAFIILFLFILNISLLIGSPNGQDIKMEISPTTNNIFKAEDSLNLTCKVDRDLDGGILLEWRLPMIPQNSQSKIDLVPGTKNLNLVVRNLKEGDSGDYKCLASSNTNPDLMWEKVVRVIVKPSKKCPDSWLQCGVPKCLHRRYACDGTPDCKGAEDEHPSLCGRNPCKNKIMCADGRCIPQSWCCDNTKDPNCTTRHLPQCCGPLREFSDNRGYTHETQRYNDVAFFQTTVYTVIGCAMAFMFIVTILVIAICRVHMRRTLVPRYASAGRRDPSGLRPNAPPLYELDVLFNRQGDFMPVNPLMVTYNINNGVQFVGRPVAPPPYCEVVAAPPREGPPPPYASDENLALMRRSSKPELAEDSQEEEPKESDSLLPAPSICVISSNTIDSNPIISCPSDTTTPIRSTYTVNLTEDVAGGSPTLTVIETQIRNSRPTVAADDSTASAS